MSSSSHLDQILIHRWDLLVHLVSTTLSVDTSQLPRQSLWAVDIRVVVQLFRHGCPRTIWDPPYIPPAPLKCTSLYMLCHTCVHTSYGISGGIRWINRLSVAQGRVCHVQRRPTHGHMNTQVLHQCDWEPRGLAERWTHGMGSGSPCSRSAWHMDLHRSYCCPRFSSSLWSPTVWFSWPKGWLQQQCYRTCKNPWPSGGAAGAQQETFNGSTAITTSPAQHLQTSKPKYWQRRATQTQLCWPQVGVWVGCSSTNTNILTAEFIFGQFPCQHFHCRVTFLPTLLPIAEQLQTLPPSSKGKQKHAFQLVPKQTSPASHQRVTKKAKQLVEFVSR